MTEVWLRTNRRVLVLAMVPVALLAVLGWFARSADWPWLGGVCLLIAALLGIGLMQQLRQPRMAYRDGHLLFHLRSGSAIAVPLEIVEAFFQGQGPAHLPGETQHQAKSINLIARLSQRETDWQQRDVKPALGNWSDGYVTIRGTWCEPITEDLIRRLNRRLGEVKREREGVASS